MTVRLAAILIAAVMGYVAVPIPVLAQSTDRSGIQGKVADQTGAILPGVTVTIASTALVAGRQVTHADAEGRYRFTALPGGVYSLTFELSGFATVKRVDVRLEAGFVATIDVELPADTVQEAVTVRADSPVIDVRTPAVSTRAATWMTICARRESPTAIR